MLVSWNREPSERWSLSENEMEIVLQTISDKINRVNEILSENEELRAKIDNITPSHTLAKNNHKLLMENKKLRECIELYAGPDCDETGRYIIKDGVKARQCLKDMGK